MGGKIRLVREGYDRHRWGMELHPPALDWTNNTPHSEAFGDMYYTPDDGLAESRYVFVQANRLTARMSDRRLQMVVAETGFGTGLNLLALWQEWRKLPQPRPRLHIITTEQAPLTVETLSRAHAAWPELAALSQELCACYPDAIAGAHRRWLEAGAITVDFLFGDAATMLKRYAPCGPVVTVDAWMLDGFAPAKNPQIWTADLFAAMAGLSGPDTTLATFTVAGAVRRGLTDASFVVEKYPGFGRKREMIIGRYQPDISPCKAPAIVGNSPSPCVIIGGGVAGVSSAWQLAQQGQKSIILESAPTVCSGASGNPASAFTPFYPAKWNVRGRMLASGFDTMRQLLRLMEQKGFNVTGTQAGLLVLDRRQESSPRSERLAKWQSSLALPPHRRATLDAQQASEQAGVALSDGGWFYPQGGWMNMASLCQALCEDAAAKIELRTQMTATALRYEQGCWCVTLANGERLTTSNVIVATAHAVRDLLPDLPLITVHGQSLAFAAPTAWRSLSCVVNAGHALIPLGDGRLQWGSSFYAKGEKPELLLAERERLLDDLELVFPDLAAAARETVKQQALEEWAGLRCTNHSYVPLIGQFAQQPEGLHLHLAHGARGALTAPLAFGAQHFEDFAPKAA